MLADPILEALSHLHALGEPRQALSHLRGIAAQAESPRQALDLVERVAEGAAGSPYPSRALARFDRWAAHLPSPAGTFSLLVEHPRLLADLLLLFAASGYLSDILAREPELYALLAGREPLPPVDGYPEAVARALRPMRRPEARRAALRRLKRREILRIAWHDLTRRAGFTDVVTRISALADALIAAALQLAGEETRPQFPTASEQVVMGVLAMGKLGGRELNYSSDVDLMFVFDSPDVRSTTHQIYARRLAERVVRIVGEETSEGRLFRVDMRLRPEGRSGELARTLAAYREYYDRWVETWERQALIKVRPVAGSSELTARYMRLAEATAYGRGPDLELAQDVQDVKAIMERRAAGSPRLNVKEGRGTIRDVEFAVQLLQLLFGREQPELRSPGTLAALDALCSAGRLEPLDAAVMRRGYRFFRAVEHRLQLDEDLPVRHLPERPEELRCLARLMGYRRLDGFLAACERTAGQVRAACDRVHARVGPARPIAREEIGPWVLALHTPEAKEAVKGAMAQRGFADPARALADVERLALSTPHGAHPMATRRAFAALAPSLFRACAASPDPDLALTAFQELAERKLVYRAFYQRFLDEPECLADLCRLTGASPVLIELFTRYPEYLDVALDPGARKDRMTGSALAQELDHRLLGAPHSRQRQAQLRRFRLRHLVRLAAAELLEDVPVEALAAEWSDVAQACLEGALRLAVEEARTSGKWPRVDAAGLAAIGLGRFGGRELLFASDLDLLYVFEPEGLHPRDYEALARALETELRTVTAEGPLFEVDLRLRPEGRSGSLVSSEEACRRYFEGRAATWEKQSFLRARPVAGSIEVAARLLECLTLQVCPEDPGPTWRDELRAMKRRIERERVAPADRDRHVKLGPGGLSDVEFLAQYLQRLHCARHPAARSPNTLTALSALHTAGALPDAHLETLIQGYLALTRLRQRLWLCLGEGRGDTLPTDPRELRRLARSLGYGEPEELTAEYRRVTASVREVYERYLGE